jgi:dihydrofolate synthase / folylpolyglutamate synthase
MSYAAAILELNAMTPELHTQPGQPRRKFSLDEIGTLLAALGNPHQRFPSVLIAGTNGKGSTASTLASILNSSGLRSGLYTSPHLVRPNERIRVRGVDISEDDFARLFFHVRSAGRRLFDEKKLPQQPSFFETLTAMAFLHFADSAVEVAVLEVGMGGRLDATNIVSPLLSIVTDISLDHTEWLGPTIAAIAREKAGILRLNGTLITLPQHPESNQVLGEVATELNVRGVSAVPYMPPMNAAHQAHAEPYTVDALGTSIRIDSPLHGAHQQRNIALAVAAAVELAEHNAFPITPASIEEGIHSTRWPGRLEVISAPVSRQASLAVDLGAPGPCVGTWESDLRASTPTQWILDVAHNPAGAWALRAALRSEFGVGEPGAPPAALVFSCLKDKPVAEIAHILFPLFERVIFAPIASPRATPVVELLAAAESVGTPAVAATSVAEALALAASSTQTGLLHAMPPPQVDFPGSCNQGAQAPSAPPQVDFVGSCNQGAQAPSAPLQVDFVGSCNQGAQAPSAPPQVAQVVVSGSVYLVGEARAFLLAPVPELQP